MRLFRSLLPWLAFGAALLVALAPAFRRDAKGAFDLATFGRLPVSADGRVKPLDTVARSALLAISGRQTFVADGRSQPAIRFLADVMGGREESRKPAVIRIDHPGVLALIDRAPGVATRFSMDEIAPHWTKILEQAARAEAIPARQRDPFQRAVLDVSQRVQLVLRLGRLETPYVVPPLAPGEEWRPFLAALDSERARDGGAMAHEGLAGFMLAMSAYHAGRADSFNTAVGQLATLLDDRLPSESRRARAEVWFNRLAPFYAAATLYVAAFLVGCAALLLLAPASPWGTTLRRTTLALLLAALVVHTVGIAARIWLQGRPPVTNLYSSAVFTGWAAVVFALVVERWSRLGLASLGAALVGFCTLIVAHHLGNDGDTMQMMQAVLDSNFWLATHVVAITLGYSAMFLAGAMAAGHLLLGPFTTLLAGDREKALSRMTYGVVCFALLLSFVGTVLGGIWADQSWGRFWGWDPKENGAALIVLHSALVLHARWAGLVRERGIAVLAVAGNIVTAWSWFGTNLLGVGLHSYGFTESGAFWLMLFVASQLAIMTIGLLPRHVWRSLRKPRPAAPAPAPIAAIA